MSIVSSFEGERRKPKGAVLFTGPDGIGDFRVRVEDQQFIGHGSMSPEASSDTQYLYRAAQDCPHPAPKTARVGEIGWGVPRLSDHSLLKSGNQIMLKEFRQAVEDRHTHLYQNPYYPPSDQHNTATSTRAVPQGAPTTAVEEGTQQSKGNSQQSLTSVSSTAQTG